MVFLGRKLSHFCQHPQTRPKVDVSIHQGTVKSILSTEDNARNIQGCSVDLLDGFSALYYDSCSSSCKYSPTDLTTNLNPYNNIVGIPNYEMELGRISLN
jgi:hypothetical protein